MKRMFTVASVVLGLLAGASVEAQDEAQEDPRKKVAIQSNAAEGVKVYFMNLPWGPQTFARMEKPGDSFYNKRSWPFARLETTRKVVFDGQKLAPGNYALVFHPADIEHPGMRLEVLKIADGEFLEPGNVMTKTPAGTSQYKQDINFESGSEVPALDVALAKGQNGLTLKVSYGDRRLSKPIEL